MIDTNFVCLTGRLVQKPELRFTKNGTQVTSFSFTVEHKNDNVSFFDCEAWKGTAELICNNLDKGSQILITGYLQQDRWEVEGRKRSKVKVVVNRIMFMNATKKEEDKQDDDIPF
ncbi:MAG: single-stranded DNA-binding protein [Petrotogales bacterium]